MKKFVSVSDSVKWVGVVDQDMKKFHGEELSIPSGTTYNSYLIRDEKIALVDTVIHAFGEQWLELLKEEINLNKIDYIIMNHNEPDHSGALVQLMKEIPDTPIYCTQMGKEIIEAYYGKSYNFNIVKTGDKLNLGKNEITFVEMKMLHWPDSMMSYLNGENILFSNDAFGQHYGANGLFNDMVDQNTLEYECLKYYACILTPFSKILERKLEEVISLGLPIDVICPSHGVIWRDNPMQIVEKYSKWCRSYKEDVVVIAYDTMWESTKKMAESIADGIREVKPEYEIILTNSAKNSENDIVTDMFRASAILFGSSTINNGILPSMAALLEGVKGVNFQDKKVAAFGSYGWNGKSLAVLNEELSKTKMTLASDGLKVKWNLNSSTREECMTFGREFAEKL
ncbi:MBL fold metallo-hydrolase [uncultured Ilyobacter sp.]|uniref:MBL fold metallo-hydrolase n=1 Tax=uncultured Ilyobacter sp. TaxID=544433 RepID=UPI0029F4C017|nr:MBL fold metallo-hydrolase [uncultured Ilyobacter sp.]